ncbi:aminotransferase-like domain-containing protein [Gluconacetobacter johannae]|uniref:PLP-dependent aminotransferase family protein n=1 Tax=Gluconacetobacter johannae TaxID=112140 RepID=A0A7W4J957_9PROT|nr:PLP-dependent aminotransferase family protein [Gluconacetobacter johannae]MBB2176992.1 PLP-dependent aminotransferase family protein [Gluconacetobacter johannae]
MPVEHPRPSVLLPRWRPVRGGDRTLIAQLEDELSARIADHALRPGSRLPSVRRMADSAGVSRFTVVEAYERLVARGLVEPRHGSGYFVRTRAAAPPIADAVSPAGAPSSRLDVAWLLRGMFDDGAPVAIPAGAGLLPPGWLDAEMVTAAIRAVGRQAGAEFLDYGHPRGHPPLRAQLASTLQSQGIAAHPDHHLMTTAGVTQGLDLVLRLLVQPGDTVLVEDPGWFLLFGRLAAYGTRIVGVPRGPDGPDLEALDRLAATHRPRLFLMNSAVHNPTGHTLGAAAAHDVLRLAERHDFLIVEDDTYADFHPGVPIRLATLDRLRRVILVGGYAKTLAAGLRVGMLAARPELIARLTELKLLAGLTTPRLGESVVHRLLHEGHYARHLTRVRQRVDQARHRCIEALTGCGLRLPHLPYAGMFVWADCGRDSETVARVATEHGVLLAPGSLFSPMQAPSTMLRFTVSVADQPKLWPVLRTILAEAGAQAA